MTTETSQTQEIVTKLDNYVPLGSSGLKVSPICLGTMDFPTKKIVLEYAEKEKNWRILEEVVRISKEVGKTPSEVAINWVLQQPGITSIVAAARNVEILEENISALGFKLTPEQLSALNDISLQKEIPSTQIPKPNPLFQASKPDPEYIKDLKPLRET
ncbi:5044_t:CDS:2 [Racocetra fulgida]|uniref:5044_t:CDS:1 n=1 Tax=Racocetra fulgida TaxID=60492 RepID=A0A9N9BJG2_9GLOM|nr:5044_t:CDS:2 [Racocetra fulgida]